MRPWNFSAGPSVLPIDVLEQAAAELSNWHGAGLSVMEMSHRSDEFVDICETAEAKLRTLLQLPDDFAVLFMQGGATAINALLPLNLIGRSQAKQADYILSGSWSNKSFTEAQRYGDMAVAASSQDSPSTNPKIPAWAWFPPTEAWQLRSQSAYVHLCSNETIGGVEFTDWPDLAQLGASDVPLIVDASSNILSRPFDFSRVGMVYAGAQKNIGPAGLTVVLIRRDLLGHALPMCPDVFNFEKVAKAHSRLNTPPTFAIYMAGLVFDWLEKQGGVNAIERQNRQKASLLYEFIDNSDFYHNPVDPKVRSRMNVPFILADSKLDQRFLDEAKAAGLVQLKGHKSVGGMRASLYNALPLSAVEALVDFMQDFEKRHG